MSKATATPHIDFFREMSAASKSKSKSKNRRTLQYGCARCGASFSHLGNYKKHVSRRNPCAASLRDVAPSMENVTVSKTVDGGAAAGEPVIININLNNSNNNTINNTNVTNITTNNTFNILAFGSEDRSHITPALLERLIAKHSAGTAVLHLVQWVHFNPSKPENMNVCSSVEEPSKARVFDGSGWRDLNKEDTALNMAKEVADDLVAHIDTHPSTATPYKAEHYQEFAEGLDYDMDTIGRTAETIDEYSYLVDAIHSGRAAGSSSSSSSSSPGGTLRARRVM